MMHLICTILFFEQDDVRDIRLEIHRGDEVSSKAVTVVRKGLLDHEPSLGMVALDVGDQFEQNENFNVTFYGTKPDGNQISIGGQIGHVNLVEGFDKQLESVFVIDSKTEASNTYKYLWPIYLTSRERTESSLTTQYFLKVIGSNSMHTNLLPQDILEEAYFKFNTKSPLDKVPIKQIIQGSAPRTLKHFEQLKSLNVTHILSLQEPDDWVDGGHCPKDHRGYPLATNATEMKELVEQYGIAWYNVPVKDMNKNSRAEKAIRIYEELLKITKGGKNPHSDTIIYIHCNAGIGRASFSHYILLSTILNIHSDIAWILLSMTRPVSFIERTNFKQAYMSIEEYKSKKNSAAIGG